jgi:poly(A) polymerase
VRISVRLGFTIEEATREAVVRNAPLIRSVSGERLREELRRILMHPTRAEGVRRMEELGLLEPTLPEVAATRGVPQPPEKHPEGDVFTHTLRALEELEDPTFPLALGALLHDVGKATTLVPGEPVRFRGHEKAGAELAGRVCRRIRLSRQERERVVWLVRKHAVLREAPKMRLSTLRRYLAEPGFAELHALSRVDRLASSGDLAAWEYVEEKVREYEGEARPAPLLSGTDVLALGLSPGPAVGEVLRAVETAQLEGEIENRDEALEMARRIVSRDPDHEGGEGEERGGTSGRGLDGSPDGG